MNFKSRNTVRLHVLEGIRIEQEVGQHLLNVCNIPPVILNLSHRWKKRSGPDKIYCG